MAAEQNGNGGDFSSLPLNGAGAEGPTESVSITGAQGPHARFWAAAARTIFRSAFQEFRDPLTARRRWIAGPEDKAGPAVVPVARAGGGPMIMAPASQLEYQSGRTE